LGLLFASVSTYDFVIHLDRQVHDVHCSFVPGLAGSEGQDSGCQIALVSPYSSVLRTWVWGGIPIALGALAVFAFLLAFATELVVTGRQSDARATLAFAIATGVPALASVVMAYIAIFALGAVCKLCVGIYVASALCVAGGVLTHMRARSAIPLELAPRPPRPRAGSQPHEPAWTSASAEPHDTEPHRGLEPRDPTRASAPWSYVGAAGAAGALFVLVPVASYVAAAPDHDRFIGTCGAMIAPPGNEVLIPLDPRAGQPPVLEILDPLCPACLGFEQRVSASGLADELDRRALLFPLDDTCNWMVPGPIHPGACAISRALLCADADVRRVLAWAFDHQEELREAAASDPEAASRMAVAAFPALGSCIDSAATKAKLNRGLRWAVQNRLPVLTPQLYVGNVKVCEEDVDLGLDFALSRMLDGYRHGTLKPKGELPQPPPEIPREAPPSASRPSSRDTAAPTATESTEPRNDEAAGTEGTTPAEPIKLPQVGDLPDVEADDGAGDNAPTDRIGEPAPRSGAGSGASDDSNSEQPQPTGAAEPGSTGPAPAAREPAAEPTPPTREETP
jgi:uncharacterized membrane protein